MQSTNSRNRFDKKDSLELGEKAERLFVEIARQAGWQVSPSSKDENIDEHWDFQIAKDAEDFKVEVKSIKRINRNDSESQSNYTWVELRNVRGEIRLAVRQSGLDRIRKGNFIHLRQTVGLAGSGQ